MFTNKGQKKRRKQELGKHRGYLDLLEVPQAHLHSEQTARALERLTGFGDRKQESQDLCVGVDYLTFSPRVFDKYLTNYAPFHKTQVDAISLCLWKEAAVCQSLEMWGLNGN